jgi:hypothetical protein
MICPSCHAEYRDGFTTCADCEVPLVADLAAAAAAGERDGASDGGEFSGGFGGGLGSGTGDPGELVPLAELGSPEMLGTLLEQLEEGQIPYVVQAGTALALAYGRDLESPGFPRSLARPGHGCRQIPIGGARVGRYPRRRSQTAGPGGPIRQDHERHPLSLGALPGRPEAVRARPPGPPPPPDSTPRAR